jgi:predicted RNA-binding Zn-ribbon protein involved in translation (DUF1610 family)
VSWIDIKYLERLQGKLEGFTQISAHPYVVNFRCPFCGDSSSRQSKKRGYVYEKGVTLNYHCHNCGASMSFYRFLQSQNDNLFREYKLDWIRSLGGNVRPQSDIFKTNTSFTLHNVETPSNDHRSNDLKLGTRIDQCDHNELVFKYVKQRRIPQKFWSSLYSSTMLEITSQIDRYKKTKFKRTPVLVIPFFNKKREFSYVVTRSVVNHSGFRYLVLEVDSTHPKIWGVEHVDWNEKIFVFEGPIDAMCCPNSLALGGSMVGASIRAIRARINSPSQVCFAYDNELSTNKQIRNQIIKRVDEGFSVVLFDKKFPGKDINEVITHDRMNPEQVYQYLNKKSYSGLNAKLEIARLLKPANRNF